MASFQILQGQPGFLQGAGTGLAQGLNQLAQSKLQEIQQANEQARFSRLLQATNRGYNKADADLFSAFPQQQRLEAIQSAPARQYQSNEQTVAPLGQIADSSNPIQQSQPQAFKMPTADEVLNQAKQVGMNLDPEKEARMRRTVDDIRSDPEKMAALERQYAQDIKDNKPIELRQPGFNGPAVPLEQAMQNTQKPAPQQDLSFRKPGAAAQPKESTEQKAQIAQQVKADFEYKEEIQTAKKEAVHLQKTLNKLKKYVNDPDFVTGYSYARQKNFTGLSKANQEFDKEVAESIIERQKNLGSRGSDQLRELIGRSLPDAYNNDKEGLLALIDNIDSRAENSKQPAELFENLTKRYGKLPTGWSDTVKELSTAQELAQDSNQQSDNEFQAALANPQEYEEGTEWDLGDGRHIVLINGQWQEQ